MAQHVTVRLSTVKINLIILTANRHVSGFFFLDFRSQRFLTAFLRFSPNLPIINISEC